MTDPGSVSEPWVGLLSSTDLAAPHASALLSQSSPLSRQPQQMPHEQLLLPLAATQPRPLASPTYLSMADYSCQATTGEGKKK